MNPEIKCVTEPCDIAKFNMGCSPGECSPVEDCDPDDECDPDDK